MKAAGSRPAADAKYLRRREAASYLGITERWLSTLQAQHLIPYYKPARNTVLFRKRDLDTFVERFRVNASWETAQTGK